MTSELAFHNASRLSELVLRSVGVCAIATTCARGGWLSFEPLRLENGPPFGISCASHALATGGPHGVLVFPEYRPLERLELFDRRLAVETSAVRAGKAGSSMGVRFHAGLPGAGPGRALSSSG